MTEWYRRKTWSENDEIEYFSKLSRARKDGRAQYLKIQAIELIETGEPKLLNVAESLLNKYLSEFSEDNFNRSSSLENLGNIYLFRNDYLKAIEYYKKAIEFEKEYPNVLTQSYLKFSEIIIKNELKENYNYVEEILLSRLDRLSFNIEKYKVFSILSIINKNKGNIELAREYAKIAEENANLDNSGFTYHKNIGIVTERDSVLDSKMKEK